MSTTKSSPVVLSVGDWNPSIVKFMQPKVNERGGKSISIISGQTNRSLHISTPLMVTWGISDFVDEKTGESDGKYSMSLSFPNDDYATASTREFLQKLKDFENQVLDDAVTNSELWWGEEMSREVAKHTFFPFLKYSKNKDTKKVDLSKPPSIRAKVPFYDGKWKVELYDTNKNLIFPCENENVTPMDFVPKLSSVACVLQCGGIWIGGKGWGLTWRLVQCVVKPREIVSVYGKCHIELSPDEKKAIETQDLRDEDEEEPVAQVQAQEVVVEETKPTTTTQVDDSDDEEAEVAEPAAPAVAAAPVKKVVKKAATIEPPPVVESVQEAAAEPVKKKVVKKKA
jgi:hypothetical protein